MLGGDTQAALPARPLPAVAGCCCSRKGGAWGAEWDSSCCVPPAGWDAMELVGRPQTPAGQCCQAAPGTALCPVHPSASRELAAAPQRLKVEGVGGHCGTQLLRCWSGVATLILHPISFLMALMQGMTGVGGELSPTVTGPCPGMGRLLCSQSPLPGGRGSPFSPLSLRLLHAAAGSSSPARGCPAPLLAPTSPFSTGAAPCAPPAPHRGCPRPRGTSVGLSRVRRRSRCAQWL